jgi:hypothetical protein
MKFQLILRWFAYGSLRVVFSTAKLNLELKPQANYIKISPNFTYILISPPIDRIWSFNWLWGDLLIVHQKLCFCSKIEPRIKTSRKRYQNKPKFYIWSDLARNRLNMKIQLIMSWFAYGSPRIVFLRQKLNHPPNFDQSLSLSLSLSL